MQIDFTKLIGASYLLDPRPPYQFVGYWPLMVFFILMVLAAATLSFWRLREWQEPYRNLSASLWTIAIIGFFLLFARNQTIAYLSTRLLLFVVILAFFPWFGYSFAVAHKKSAEQKISYEQRAKLLKYLPKKKR